jgi:undecaprenyl pyrophosphate synthase
MSWLAYVLLRIVHAIYALVLSFSTRWRCNDPVSNNFPLGTAYTKLPAHLAVILVAEEGSRQVDEMLVSVERIVGWCRKLGIEQLTVYDKDGEC